MRWNELRWTRWTGVLLMAVFCFHVWRAATAAITTDEAFTFNEFVAPPLLQVLTSYDANHHVLHSLLCKAAISLLGKGDLRFRLPALLGTLLYLWSVWRLTRQRLGNTPLMAATALLLAVHAGLIDYFSLARGYSLGMGFLVYAMAETGVERYRRASLGLGLAVASNPVYIVPAAAWILSVLVTKRLWRRVDELVAPGLVTALVVLAIPASRAVAERFYYGVPSPWISWQSLMDVPGWPGLSQLLGFAIPIAVLWGAWIERGAVTMTLALCLASIAVLHWAAHFPWPYGRTGIYLIPLVFLLAAEGARRVRWGAIPLAVLALVSLSAVRPHVYAAWSFDADNKAVAKALDELPSQHPVAVQVPMEQVLRYYRPGTYVVLRPGVHAEVYVLRTDEVGLLRPQGIRVLRRFARSGVEIAVSEPPR
ncbi:hypothetical protein [Paludibaculum fermentans]|uniref:hypothetical protein n=1 Tax=Paludibaculum fermentans TaxID=1473598 RepID=UPI003EBC3BE2